MQLKSLVSTALLLSSLSYLAGVAGAPQSSAFGSAEPTSVSADPSATSADSSSTSSVQSSSGTCCTCTCAAGGDSSSNSTSSTNSPSSSNSTSTTTSPSSSNSTSTNSTSSGGGFSGPHFVIYADKWDSNGAPDVSKIEGFNVFALSFLLSTGPADQAQAWEQLDDSKRKQIKSQYESAGIKLIVSAFGSTELPTTSGADPQKVAESMADWVIKMGLDGIDVDYEDLDAMNKADGKAEEWLSTFTKTLRGKLPQGKYIVTHAPVAPWFNSETYKSGAYTTVHKNVGDMIDWYNVQFYNQNDYDDCNTLLSQSKTKTSVFEIAKTGVDQSKIVIGKPATAADATNGFVDTKTLADCVSQAKQKGWNAGVMVWEYPNADSSWIKTVRGDAFPLGN
ncbi:hypothetical protein ACEPAH_9060 [Sanghuangporus vaninii]